MKFKRMLFSTTDTGGGVGEKPVSPEQQQPAETQTGNQPQEEEPVPPPELKYTDTDFQKIQDDFNKRLQNETVKAVDDALKKAKMSADEKIVYEQQQQALGLEKREKELTLRELKAESTRLLGERNLPLEALDMVIADNSENTAKRLESFKTIFDKAVQEQVEKRLAGKTPPGSSGTGGTAGDSTREQIRKGLRG